MADMAEMAQEALFADEPTLRVGELAARLTRAVAAAFPGEVWVRGEVDGLRRPGPSGHVYFNLCERNSRRGPTSTDLPQSDVHRVDTSVPFCGSPRRPRVSASPRGGDQAVCSPLSCAASPHPAP